MDRNDVSWHGYWPACPTPFHADQSLDLDSFRALLECYIGEGVHGLLVNGTSGEWFSQTTDERHAVVETAVEVAAGRVPVVAGCTSYTALEAAELGRHALAAGRLGHQLDAAAVLEDVPGRDGAVLHGHLGPHRRAAARLQLAARLQRRDRPGPRRPDRRHRERRRHQGLDAERAAVLRDDAPGRRPRARVRPVHVERGLRAAAAARRRRLHRRRHAVRAAGRRVLGELLARRPRRLPRARRAHRPAVPEALAAGRLGRQVRRVPEPAEGDHEDARPARRRGAPPAAARDRSRRASRRSARC